MENTRFDSDSFKEAILKRVRIQKYESFEIGSKGYVAPYEEYYLTIFDPRKVEKICFDYYDKEEPYVYKGSQDIHGSYMSTDFLLFLKKDISQPCYLEELGCYKGLSERIIEDACFGYWGSAEPDHDCEVSHEDFKEYKNYYTPNKEITSKLILEFKEYFKTKMQWFGRWYEGPDINEQIAKKDEILLAIFIEKKAHTVEDITYYNTYGTKNLTDFNWDSLADYLEKFHEGLQNAQSNNNDNSSSENSI